AHQCRVRTGFGGSIPSWGSALLYRGTAASLLPKNGVRFTSEARSSPVLPRLRITPEQQFTESLQSCLPMPPRTALGDPSLLPQFTHGVVAHDPVADGETGVRVAFGACLMGN